MNTRIPALIAGLAAAGALALSFVPQVAAVGPIVPGGPSGNGACAPRLASLKLATSVDPYRAFGDCEIQRRFTTLDTLSKAVSGSKVLTAADAATLAAEIGATKSGLTSLKTTIDAETSIPALKTEIARIATDFRVYVLVGPQVRLVTAADALPAAQAAFAKIDTTLTGRIAAAKAAGKDTAAAQADLDAMNKAVTQAVGLATPLPAKLLPLTPAQYNAGTASPLLNSARTDLLQARNLLKAAARDARACRDALK